MSQPLHDPTDLKVSSSRTGQPRSRPWHCYRRHVVWDATVWVLFLALPVIQLLLGSFTWWQRLLGLAGVLGFIADYVWAFSTPNDRASRVSAPSTDLPARALLREFAVQGFFTVLTLPALGWWAVCLFPFFYSLGLFSMTLCRDIPIVVMATGLLVAASLLWNTHPESHRQVLGISLTEIPIIIARIALELQECRTTAERELTPISQRGALGRDIHDILGHFLAVLTLKAEITRWLIERGPTAASRELNKVITLARRALASVRSAVTRLWSPDLDNQMKVTRTALGAARIRLDMTGGAQGIPERQRTFMTQTLREATANVIRHAQAATVTIHLEPGLLRMSGDGVDLVGDQPGDGLAGLRSRCEQGDGSLTITSPLTDRTDSSGTGMTGSADVTTGGTRPEVRLP